MGHGHVTPVHMLQKLKNSIFDLQKNPKKSGIHTTDYTAFVQSFVEKASWSAIRTKIMRLRG
jgi:hypothetical protein